MSMKVLNLSSPFQTEVSETDTLTVKGFASVSAIDRDREIVADPREFDIDTFLASPTLLLNHKFIRSPEGNEDTAGVITFAEPAFVGSIKDGEVIVHSMKSNDIIDSIEQKIAPKLREGDRGLFIRADVRNPIAKQKVMSGELGGLSWRGYSRKSPTYCDDGMPCKVIKNIDLLEISLVHHPNQPQSTFMIAKSVNGETEVSPESLNDFSVYGMRFRKNQYPSSNTVREYLKAHSLEGRIEEDDEFFVAFTGSTAEYEVEKSCAIPVGDIELLSAPEKEQEEMIGVHVGKLPTNPVEDKPMASETKTQPESDDKAQKEPTAKRLRLFFLDEQGLLTRFPGMLTQSMKSVTTADGEEIDILTLELPEDNPAETNQDEPVAEQKDDQTAKLQSEISELKNTISEMKDLLQKPEPTPEPESEPEPTSENQLEVIKRDLEELTNKYVKAEEENEKLKGHLVNIVERFNSQVPSHAARDERVEQTQKSVEPDSRTIAGSFISRTFANSR